MTQKEIATALNLSKGTISLVLSGSPLVSEETRKRVLAMAEKLNYRPNLAARSISTGKTMSIGLILPSIAHPFNAALVNGMHTQLLEEGYFGLYYPSNGPDDYKKALDALIPRRVDGVVAVATAPEMIDALEKENVPSVFFCANREGVDEVTHDMERGGWLAATHLSTLGHVRIGFLGPTREEAGFSARFKGFSDALRSYSIPLPEQYVCSFVPGFGESSAKQGLEAMKSLLQLPKPPTAIFTHNDQLAIGAMRAVFEAGLKVPGDISIVGHDDVYEGRYLPVTLTTVALPMDRIARELVNLILNKIRHRDNPQRKALRISLEPNLVLRESTGRPGMNR